MLLLLTTSAPARGAGGQPFALVSVSVLGSGRQVQSTLAWHPTWEACDVDRRQREADLIAQGWWRTGQGDQIAKTNPATGSLITALLSCVAGR
jgi:hypothetical protein